MVEFDSELESIDTVVDSDEGEAVAVSDPPAVTVTVFAPTSESPELDSTASDFVEFFQVYKAYPPTATRQIANAIPRKQVKLFREEFGGGVS